MGNHFLCHSANPVAKSTPKTDPTACSESVSSVVSVVSEDHTKTHRVSIKSFICESMNLHNGITGKYISQRLVSIAAAFWITHIDPLSPEYKLEIGATMFFGMIASNNQARDFFSSDINLKQHSVKFLDMIGYLIRSLLRNDVDVQSTLRKLGGLHQTFGVERCHFVTMSRSMHEAMAYYFPKQYTVDVRYAMDQIIITCADIMTPENGVCQSQNSLLRVRSFHGANTPFLVSLETCLASGIGCEYLYSYLKNQSCDEISVYLKLMRKFKDQRSDQERYMVAKEMVQCCIVPDGEFAINISYETRKSVLETFHTLPIGIEYFKNVEIEMRRLIIKNYWSQFVDSIASLRNSVSFID